MSTERKCSSSAGFSITLHPKHINNTVILALIPELIEPKACKVKVPL